MRPRSFFVFALATLLFVNYASAAEVGEPILLWPQGAPGEAADADAEKQEPLREGDTTIRISNVTRPTITFYRPAKDRDTGAAFVVCPGGGYGKLAYNKEGTEVAEWLTTLGVTGVVLKYRVPGSKGTTRGEAPLQDAQRALGWVRHRASEYGLNPNKIGILGFSAGGHLAANASNNYEKRTYDPVDDADRVSCKSDFSVLIYPAYLADKKTHVLAPEIKVTKDTPPTFIAMTEDDGIGVECGLFYYLALKQNGVKAEMHLYPEGGHGYGLRPSDKLISTWPARAADWMRASGVTAN